MMNEPAYFTVWAGCTAMGVVPAFLNTNLRRKLLLHCVDTADAKIMIVGNDPVLFEVLPAVLFCVAFIGDRVLFDH